MPKVAARVNQRSEPEMFGQCRTATLVAEGKIGSTTDAEGWHKLCKGVTVDGRGVVHRCICPHHEGERRCVDCGELDAELDVDNPEPAMQVRCADREACAERFKARLAANPAMQRYRELDRRVAEIKAAEAPAKQEEQRGRREKTITPGRCHHCGEQTRGGNFAAGHDMKLKGILLRAARDGDERALAEFMERGWFKDAKTHKVPQELVDAAEALGTNSSTWLTQRVEQRLAMVDAGVDPEEAVRTQ